LPQPEWLNGTTVDDSANERQKALGHKFFVGPPLMTSNGTKTCGEMLTAMSAYKDEALAALEKDIADGKDIQQRTGAVLSASAQQSGDSKCSNNIGALGWILCPVVTLMGGVADWIYNFLEERFLPIDSTNLLATSGTSTSASTYEAWGQFRDIANIAFVIFFLVVIFSQPRTEKTKSGAVSQG
jgi:hypothetical protein